MQIRNILITVFALLIGLCVNAQESLFDLKQNVTCFGNEQNQNRTAQSSLLSLPFIDDFSTTEVQPNAANWEDDNVFINSAMCINPISYGVATFDGTDKYGFAYDPLFALNSYGGCDTLTSKAIDLSGVTLGDSLYISFYYQAGGLGDYPNSLDSLVLEFKRPDSTWVNVWGERGVQPADFQQVIFYVGDETLYHSDFQMRFRNYGQRTGINDLWHLDYVKLDVGRTADDVLLQDVAFVRKPSSILTTYMQMPWKHFFNYQTEMLSANHFITIRNSFDQVSNTSYEYSATEMISGTTFFNSSTQAANVYPFSITDYVVNSPEFLTDISGDGVDILLEYVLDPSGDVNRNNDTIRVLQSFGNEFAYDDGIAERAYGVFGQSAEIAQKFVLNEPDELQAIKIHFTTIEEDQSNRLFNIKIWKQLEGINNTGETIEYEEARIELESPQYIYEANGFSTYVLETPLALTDTFYIGIQQDGSAEMTMGFDMNNNSNDKLYYNIAGAWNQSNIEGALMIRPVMNNSPVIAALDNSNNLTLTFDFSIFPNPAKNQINVKTANNNIQTIEILSIIGQQLINSTAIEGLTNIDISSLIQGVYLLKVIDKNGNSQTTKFIKSN